MVNALLTVFPMQMHRRLNLTIYHKIGQGQPMVIIYIGFVERESSMLHAKFKDYWCSSSEEAGF